MTISNIKDDLIVSFGKYKGRKFLELKRDKSYYHWLKDNWKDVEKYFKVKQSNNNKTGKIISLGKFDKVGLCILCEMDTNLIDLNGCCEICCNPYNQNKIPITVIKRVKELIELNGKI